MEKRPERDQFFSLTGNTVSPPALLSWVLSARPVNEHSSPTYVRSAEAAG